MAVVQPNPIAYYIGHTTNDDDRYKASSGGIGTAITKYLLSQPEYGTSITFVFDKEQCMYVSKLIYSADEINVCGSIYHDVDIVRFVKTNLERIKGGIVLTCAPCQVVAVRQLLNKANIKNFILSYCCSGQTTIEGTWKYFEFLGIRKEDVINMQYRGNGWPSGIQIWKKDGTVIQKPNYTEPWITLHQSKLYTPRRCFLCKWDTGRRADLCLADSWLPSYIENETIGQTMFLPFTELGAKVIEELKEKGFIQYEESKYDDYAIAQQPNVHKELRVKEDRSYIDKQMKLISKGWYFRWATKNLSNMQKHLKVMHSIHRISSRKNFITFIMNIFKKIQNHQRFESIKKKLGSHNGYINISGGVIFNNPQCIHIGSHVGIGADTFFGPVTMENGIAYNPKIIIGEGTWVGKHCSIAAIDRVEIGKHVLFAGYVHITDHSHGYEDITMPISPQPLISKGPVIIEDDCWLGFSCEILSGVHIGKHCVVAARAVVTKDVPPYSIVAGNPARIVKQYNFDTKKWESVKK